IYTSLMFHIGGDILVVEWLYNEEANTLGHISKLKLEGRNTLSPQHALTLQDLEAIKAADLKAINENIMICGESLDYSTFRDIGKKGTTTDSLIKRFKDKTVTGRINLVYARIPSGYAVNGSVHPVLEIDDLQISAIVGAQLEANASALIPPVPNGIKSYKVFKRVLDRTKIENQTYRKDKELVGLIPKTDDLHLIPQMVKDYTKLGVKVFAMDFSGAYLPQALIRTTVTSIRKNLKIKNEKEPKEKHYYMHVFNAATSVKTAAQVTSMTDILTHAYGVDSTSGVMWGGGKMDRNKLRYFNMSDYGAYSIGKMSKNYSITAPFTIPDSTSFAYKTLRAHRIVDYHNECKVGITASISSGKQEKSYASYLNSKTRASEQVFKVLSDIKEIKARQV
ncbi:MAG: hypothetical protein MUO82_12095, partial [Candidatus Thermoplasmatota archaeon]|nr:hypothetical protein [Candidatus Thermoplasmatota archaeon]